jgi:hypothetical protein
MIIPPLTDTCLTPRSSSFILLGHPFPASCLPGSSAATLRLAVQNIHQDLPDLPLTGLPPIVVVAVAVSVSVETVVVVVVVDESVVVIVATSDSVEA